MSSDMTGEPTGEPIGHVQATCLFCRIVRGEIPAATVFESDDVLAFRDISPTAPTHVLVIPKRHIENAGVVESSDGAVLASMLLAARAVAVSEGIGERGYRLVFNVGEDSGNSVAHLHLHVLGGRVMGWPAFAS